MSARVTLAGVIALVALAACGSSRGRDRHSPDPGRPPTTRRSAAIGAYRVGVTNLTLAEPASASTATAHTSAGNPVRELRTAIAYPALGAPNGRENPGAAPDASSGPYPLVVFSQGFNVSAASYAALVDAWTSAGYVVAAPTYPDTDPSVSGGPDEADLVNHPADLRYVLNSLLSSPPSSLRGLIDNREVALVGQSDGGDVSLAVADNSCCSEASVKAAVILSGAQLASFGGSYRSSRAVPLLVVQGSDDTINPPGCSVQLYDQSPAPKYYVDLLGASHLPPYLDPGTDQAVVERTTADFLDAYLKHTGSGLSALARDGDAAGAAKLFTTPSLKEAGATYCPGAP